MSLILKNFTERLASVILISYSSQERKNMEKFVTLWKVPKKLLELLFEKFETTYEEVPMEQTFDAIIQGWFLVTLCNDNDEPTGEVLWGIVIDDQKRRFQPGHYVCTSSIIEHITPSLFRTMNTVYKCVGQGEFVTMGIRDLNGLRQGFSPEEIKLVAGLQRKPHWHEVSQPMAKMRSLIRLPGLSANR
jgi:hypothetical protein